MNLAESAIQPTLCRRLVPLVPGLPSWLAERLGGNSVSLRRPGRAVRLRARQPRRTPAELWAPLHRVVTDGAHVGPWRYEYAPHTKKILELYGQPWVQQLWFCGVDQSGKTNTMLNAMGWGIDCAPGDIFYVMPTEHTADKVAAGKIRPMLHASPRLQRYLSRRHDDESQRRMVLANGVTIHTAWANSNVSMATYSAKYIFADEIDQFPATGGTATDPVRQILKRLRTYRGLGKAFFCSTPQNRFIYRHTMACAQVWEHRLWCPHCGGMVRPTGDHLVVPEGAEPETLPARAVQVACPECGGLWGEQDLQLARLSGGWVCIRGAEVAKPDLVGVHHRAWDCLDVPLLEIARAWLRKQSGLPADESAWHHGIEAEDVPERAVVAVTSAGLLRFRASDRPRNLVPPDTAMVWLLVDTQQVSFYYEVWACGYAPGAALHMMRHGQVQTFADLEGLLEREWLDHAGHPYHIRAGLIDSGGTRAGWKKHSRTVEVYEWCSRHRTMMPHKGVAGGAGEIVSYRSIVTLPGTSRAIKGGLTRVNIRVDDFKDQLERLLAMEPDDAGALSFHAGIDEHFAAHFTAEKKTPDGGWVHDRRQRNDYWDCTNYALALRHMVKSRLPRRPGEKRPARQADAAEQKKSTQSRW